MLPRILIVEDSATQREMLHYTLEQNGFNVIAATNGQEALLKIAAIKPDAVVTDIIMPQMDGYALCRAIKSQPELRHIPVLLLTSLADSKDIIVGLQCGADSFIAKPYAESDLLARINHVLANRGFADHALKSEPVELVHEGTHYQIHADRRQILDLLLSVYDTAVRRNQELIKTQLELKQLNDELEQKVADRTRKLQTSNDSLETFCYSIAHDLRAPLRGISGYVTLLGEDYAAKLDETAQEYVSRAANAVQRMDGLLRDLLAYGRVSRSDAPMSWLDFNAELEQSIIDLAPDIARTGATVSKGNERVRLWGNATLLAQILQNLLSNAIKFMRPGVKPEVRIETGYAANRVFFQVIDNGIGIPHVFQKKIFNVFEKLHVDQDYPGSGIGLAIVKQAVERMGGTVAIHSEEDQGSCFEISFPHQPEKESPKTEKAKADVGRD